MPTDLAPARPTAAPPDVDTLVDATPAHRDRVVDALRALSIVVVVVWHWALSVTHVDAHGALTMPNPIDAVPGLWLATWVLQIMPVFFVVGGYANLAAWEGVERRGGGWTAYARRRLDRLVRPVGVFVALWAALDVAVRTARPGTPSVVEWGAVVFVPLWFLASYVAVVLLAPAAAALHRRAPRAALAGLAAAVAAVDLVRFGTDLLPGGTAMAAATSLLVWLFAHQLGFWWRDGTATAWSLRRRALVATTGVGTLAALTSAGPYPRSMVAVRGEAVSNMFPTTAAIAALAVFQFGLALLARPALERLLARRAVWRAAVQVSAVAMTVFTWHMTALAAVLGAWLALGLDLADRPTTGWWLQRPVWLLLPGAVLAVLVRVFARHELPRGARA